jgi:hypothetical protein
MSLARLSRLSDLRDAVRVARLAPQLGVRSEGLFRYCSEGGEGG